MLDSCDDLDFVEVSGGTAESPQVKTPVTKETTLLREGFFLDFASKCSSQLHNLCIMLTGGFRSKEGMNNALAQGVHLLGVARPFCLQPNWPNLMLDGDIDRLIEYDVDKQANTLWHVKQLTLIGLGHKPDLQLTIP